MRPRSRKRRVAILRPHDLSRIPQRRRAGSAIELIDEGRHALAAQERVPLFELRVSDGLWLMNKAGLLQLEHFNKSNALSWALTMGLFATPVIYSERPWNQIVGEAYYIQLGPNDRFGWTEPEGHVYQIASENLSRLQEEIYRVCYLMTQATGRHTPASAQSGLSKMRDFAITQEVLRAYGDAVKDTMKRIIRAVRPRAAMSCRSTFRAWMTSISAISARICKMRSGCCRSGSNRRH